MTIYRPPMMKWENDKWVPYGEGYNNPSPVTGQFSGGKQADGSIRVTAESGSNTGKLFSVEAIWNFLGIHEYYGHGVKLYSDMNKTHYLAYYEQYKHYTFKKLPRTHRAEILENYYEYLRVENPALYNKHIKEFPQIYRDYYNLTYKK